jgi:hypothetical protein
MVGAITTPVLGPPSGIAARQGIVPPPDAGTLMSVTAMVFSPLCIQLYLINGIRAAGLTIMSPGSMVSFDHIDRYRPNKCK